MTERFGDYARQIRVSHRIPIKTVADELGYSTVYISDIERGHRNPPAFDKLLAWANVIGADTREFINRAEIARGSVELPVGSDLRPSQNELALALARAWKDLTPEQEGQLKAALGLRHDRGDE